MEIHWKIGRIPTGLLLILSILLLALVGYVDYITGEEIAFSIFYTAPVALVAWNKKAKMTVLLSVLAAALWVAADLMAGAVYAHPLIPYWNGLVRLSFFLIVGFLLLRLKQELDRATEMSKEDFLTKISNGRAFYHLAESLLGMAKRHHEVFSVVYFDIDNFKMVNDTLGHSEGDRLLFQTAYVIKKSIRIYDMFARLGGDEFVLLFPETGPEILEKIMNKLTSVLLVEMKVNKWPATFSFGAVTFKKPPSSVDQMIKIADELMYEAKHTGKNKVSYRIIE